MNASRFLVVARHAVDDLPVHLSTTHEAALRFADAFDSKAFDEVTTSPQCRELFDLDYRGDLVSLLIVEFGADGTLVGAETVRRLETELE